MGGGRRGGEGGYGGGGGGGTCAAYFAFLGVIRAEIPRRKSDTVVQRLERRYMFTDICIYTHFILLYAVYPRRRFVTDRRTFFTHVTNVSYCFMS